MFAFVPTSEYIVPLPVLRFKEHRYASGRTDSKPRFFKPIRMKYFKDYLKHFITNARCSLEMPRLLIVDNRQTHIGDQVGSRKRRSHRYASFTSLQPLDIALVIQS